MNKSLELKNGDTIIIHCTVKSVTSENGVLMCDEEFSDYIDGIVKVSTNDGDVEFDAYIDEIGIESEEDGNDS